jgi:PAP2 superfamily
MKTSMKMWGLIGAAAIFAPMALSAPALADGGASIGNRETKSARFRGQVESLKAKTTMGGRAANLTSARGIARNSTLDRLLEWHDVMLDANALDHTAASGFAGDQQGPVRNSRAFAIVQIAVFDAVNAFDNRYQSYSRGIPRARAGASKDAAIAQAAFTALSAMYPRQAARLQQLFSSDMSQMQGSAQSIADGRAVGLAAANAILAARASDGAGPAGTSPVVPFGAGGMTASGPLNIFGEQVNGGDTAAPRWTPDPFPFQDGVVSGVRDVALGSNWGSVTPFVLRSGDQFRIPAYPNPGSPRFRAAYNDVFKNGSDPEVVPGSTNTAAKQFIGNYWGYDGAPLLGTPPRLYGQIAVTVANARGLTDVNDYARLLALVHTTMGDSGIAAWDSKYFHNYWRPATGVPGGDLDGDPRTAGDPNWRPFGASVVNLTVPERFTPPFPAYPSGHATFGAATMQSLSSVFGNTVRFTFVSDEYNGTGVDPRDAGGSVDGIRPFVPVRYRTLLEAQQENGRSRVFNGVHWEPDDTEGQNLGTSIVRYTLTQKFKRR